MKRSPMPPRKKRISPVSKKQAGKIARRKPVRESFLRKHRLCEMRYHAPFRPRGYECTLEATDVHEPWTRARGGPIDDERNMVALCRPCHQYVTFSDEGIRYATENGFLISAREGPRWLSNGGRDQ